MNRLVSHAIVLSLGVASCGAAPPNLAVTPAQWREDLRYFAQELPKRHINAFHHISKDAFAAEVSDLDGRLGRLDGDESFVGLQQIARSIGDGHTGVDTPDDAASLPLNIRHFGGQYRVVSVAPGHEALLGTQLVAIDGVPVEEVRRRLLTVTAADEGMGVRDWSVDRRMTVGLYLHGLGVTPRRDQAALTLRSDDGRTFTADLAALPAGAKPAWVSASAATPLMTQHEDNAFWCAPAAPDTVYCDFRSYGGLWRSVSGLHDVLASPPKKLVIDMRQNGGGDYNVGLMFVVGPIQHNVQINRKGHLFVLVGPATFSAAMSNSAHFRQRTAAILVGETIGERPNSYQERRELTLPNSHLVVSYSTRLYQFAPGDPTNEIRPDVPIETGWADYKAGRDPVLQWVIDQPDAP
ncbi:MAG: hypothetical protein ACHP84_12005 [Caulobacterales bacterium]